MQVGDWAYCPEEDIEFKIVAFVGDILMKNEIVGYHKNHCEPCDTEECRRCDEVVPMGSVTERYSTGCPPIYAGKMCEKCAWDGYTDHCGLDGYYNTQADVDEPIEPEDSNGL